jgi:hypothetical protein
MASSASGVNFTLTPDDNLDMVIFQGCDIYFTLTIKDALDALVNVAGWSAELKLRSRADAEDVVAAFTVGNGRVAVGGSNGLITFTMTDADCAALPAGDGVYDIRITKSDGFRWQPQSGKYKITREVSRS